MFIFVILLFQWTQRISHRFGSEQEETISMTKLPSRIWRKMCSNWRTMKRIVSMLRVSPLKKSSRCVFAFCLGDKEETYRTFICWGSNFSLTLSECLRRNCGETSFTFNSVSALPFRVSRIWWSMRLTFVRVPNGCVGNIVTHQLQNEWKGSSIHFKNEMRKSEII